VAAGSAAFLLGVVLYDLKERQQQAIGLECLLVEPDELAARSVMALLDTGDVAGATAEGAGDLLASQALDLAQLLHGPAEHRAGLTRHEMGRKLWSRHEKTPGVFVISSCSFVNNWEPVQAERQMPF
jgi:hypothetical protein